MSDRISGEQAKWTMPRSGWTCDACGQWISAYVTGDHICAGLIATIAPPEHRVVLRFKSAEEKSEFLGQLSDGWGENCVNLEWPWQDGIAMQDAAVIECEMFHEEPRG